MKYALVSALALPALVSAHNVRDVAHGRRQASSSVSSAPVASSSVTAAASAATSSVSLTFTLLSTNPTALPLTEIVSGASSQPTVAASTTFAAGSTPTYLKNAPALPDITKLVPSNYPALDKTPPTDSAEVQAWIQEVANSGVTIPDVTINAAGGCPANPAAVNNNTACYWTCGGCVSDEDITACPDQLHWGLTYDDGPALYTGDLLAYLDAVDLKATMFTVGSRVISYPALLQEEYMAQHQIAVHTWSHPPMTTLTNEQVIAELGWSRKVIKDVLGVTPLFWRPPYGDVDNRVRAIAKAMGLQTSMWTRISAEATFDTGDFDIAGGLTTSTQVLNNWESIMGNATTISTGFIVLEHDLFQQTVDMAIDYILPDALARKPALTIQPIITCLNLPLEDAYLETNNNASHPVGASVSGQETGSATASGSAGSAQASGSSSGDSSNGAMAPAQGSLAAVALGLVSGLAAVFL